jgi:hypothetical protein
MRLFQLFRVTGVANTVTYDGGLKSTETEKKLLIAVHVELAAYAATDDNEIQGWLERAKLFEFPEKMFNTELAAATAPANVKAKMDQVPVDLEIPVGEIFKISIKCAATLNSMRGAYEYEIVA